MKNIGYSLIDLGTHDAVWSGYLPARVELRDQEGTLTLRADFDRAGLIVPDSLAPTHKMVERLEIEAPTDNSVRGSPTESYDGDIIVVDPHWTDPPPVEEQP